MILNKAKKIIPVNKQKSITYYNNGLVLASPSPFKNELIKFNFLYALLSVVFLVILYNDFSAVFSILLGICTAAMIIDIIAAFKIDKIRSIEFNLSAPISREQLSNIITLPLTQLNMKVENLPHYIRITHNKLQYDIIIYPNKNSFRIWPQKTLFSRLFLRTHTKLYKNAILSVPIISYTIQTTINKSFNI